MDFAAITNSLATLSLLSAGAGALLFVALALPGARRRLAGELAGETRVLLAVAWLVAAVSTGGSLYFSQSAGFPPCVLCWYQRIAMYPLVLVLGAGALFADRSAWRYGLPLSATGLAIALYHISVQLRPGVEAGVCSADVPCTVRYVAVFGFVSIPVMAAGGFLLISALLLAVRLAPAREP